MNKAFRFVSEKGHFKLVVMARTERSARRYVRDQAVSSLAHRALKFVGEGTPTGDGWTGAVADRPEVPDWMREPVIWPETGTA